MSEAVSPIPHLHAVVLAGGSGTRFWPLSRELSPKQMLSIFGGVSLIAQAVHRVEPLLGDDHTSVVTSELLLDEMRNHLASQPEIDTERIEFLAEPSARNTAPAIALAAAYLARRDPEAIMAVLPSDHLLEDGPVWEETVRLACKAAADGALVTIGLRPTHPETGYGYIRAGDVLEGFEAVAPGALAVHRAAEFVEKPDAATAERYVASGDYLWNSGMLIARVSAVLEELKAAGRQAATADSSHGEIIADTAEWLASLPASEWVSEEARDRYQALPAVPFDRAVLEVSGSVAVVPAQLEWSDVGSLLSLRDLAAPDDRGNVLVGRMVDVDSHGVIGYSADRLVATLGLRGVVVVDTSDATLVADATRTQDVRLIVDALKALDAPEVAKQKVSLRPWGSWTMLLRSKRFQIKEIFVLPGKRLSLQSHESRSEHWVVVEGTALVERDGETIDVDTNESVFIPPHTRHRLANDSHEPLRVIEVAVGDYLGEDDIVRYEDDWGR